MPRRSVASDSRQMPRCGVMGRDRAACLAEHGVAVDRCAREIGAFLKATPSALAATEHQTVGRSFTCCLPDSSIAWILKITVRIGRGPVLYSYPRSAWYPRYCIS